MASLQCLYTCRQRNKENMLDILSEMSDISDRRCQNHPLPPRTFMIHRGGIWSFSGDLDPLCVPKGRFYFVVMF